MTLYIQLRDEIVDDEPARQMWIKADSIEVCYCGITYLDSKTGKWLWLERVSDHDDTEWRFCGDVELNDGWDADIAPFDFMFIRDRLMENCKLGYTGE
jgi:hypothetical protein